MTGEYLKDGTAQEILNVINAIADMIKEVKTNIENSEGESQEDS